MKKKMKNIIIFVVIIIVSITSVVFYKLSNFENELNEESKKYVDEVAPLVLKSKNYEELYNNASPGLIKIFNDNPEMSKSLFDTQTEKLGLLENYKESKGQAVIKFTGLRDLREGMGYKYSVLGFYTIEATFENGSALVVVDLVRLPQNNEWRIQKFGIKSFKAN